MQKAAPRPAIANYLSTVADELGGRIRPALEAGHHQQVAMCGQFILAKLLTDQRHLPRLEARALADVRAQQDALKALQLTGDAAQLVARLESELLASTGFQAIEHTLQALSSHLLKRPESSAWALNKSLVGIETRLYADYRQAYLDEIARSSVTGETKEALTGAQRARLTDWLRQRFPGNESIEITGLKLIPGGFSKHTIFVFLANARTLPDTVVVRLDWSGSSVGTTVTDEYNIIETLFKAGVNVPQPFALEAGGDVLGGPFLLVSKAEGSNPGDSFDVMGGSKALALDIACNLAKLHAVPVQAFGDKVAGAGETTCDRVMREINKFEADWRALSKPSASMETVYAWLKRNIALADGSRCLIHKDPGCHNMLAHEDKLSALLDWETAAIGNPAQDLGYVAALIRQMCDWKDFIAAYEASGGPKVPQEQIDFYELWGFTWVNTMVMQAQAAFDAGLIHEIRAGFAGTYLLARTEARMRDKLYQMI